MGTREVAEAGGGGGLPALGRPPGAEPPPPTEPGRHTRKQNTAQLLLRNVRPPCVFYSTQRPEWAGTGLSDWPGTEPDLRDRVEDLPGLGVRPRIVTHNNASGYHLRPRIGVP